MPQLELIVVLIWLATSGGADKADAPPRPTTRPHARVAAPAKDRTLTEAEERRLRRNAKKSKRDEVTAHVLERFYEASRDADHFRERLVAWLHCEDDPEAGTLTVRLPKGGIVFITYDVKTRKLSTFHFYPRSGAKVRLLLRAH